MADTITVSLSGVDALAALFAAMPAKITRASKRAMKKTVVWVAGQSRKAIASELGTTQHGIKKRITTRVTDSRSPVGLVWLGLNRLDAQAAGKPVQQKTGARAGKHKFPGAFVAKIYTPEDKIWIRLHSKLYDSTIYPYKSRGGLYGHAGNSFGGRFPVVKATLAMDTPAVRAIIAAQAQRADARASALFANELNYEVNVKGTK